MWQSPDPILNEYMSGQTNGGVFNPKNLNLFTYTANNPVNYTDPTGKFYEGDKLAAKTDYGSPREGLVLIGEHIPGVSNAMAGYELKTGKSLADGHELTGFEKGVTGASIAAGPLARLGGRVLNWAKGLFKKNPIPLTKARFGHTFAKHGEDSTEFLLNRAKGSGQAQGQFLDNQIAAKFIENNLDKVSNGAVSLPVPKNFPARIINPDGTFSAPSSIRLVPGGKGVKTAYPEP